MNNNNPLHNFGPLGVVAGVANPLISPTLLGPMAQHFSQFHRPTSPISRENLPSVVKAVLAMPVEYYQSLATAQPVSVAEALTNVAFILDASESMKTGKSATIEGFNSQITQLREGAKGAGKTTFTEVLFNHEVSIRRVASSLESLPVMSDESYRPSGSTALYDALGDTLTALLQTPRMDSPATATFVTLFTDGDENTSKRYDASILSDLVKRLEATGRWTFALVGPRNGVASLANLLSVRPGNVAGYDPSSVYERQEVFGRMAGASANYMSLRSMGATQSMSLYAGDKAA